MSLIIFRHYGKLNKEKERLLSIHQKIITKSEVFIEEIDCYSDRKDIDETMTAIIDLKIEPIENEIEMWQKKLADSDHREGRGYHLSKGQKTKIYRRMNNLKYKLKNLSKKEVYFFVVVVRCFNV